MVNRNDATALNPVRDAIEIPGMFPSREVREEGRREGRREGEPLEQPNAERRCTSPGEPKSVRARSFVPSFVPSAVPANSSFRILHHVRGRRPRRQPRLLSGATSLSRNGFLNGS